MFLEKHKRKLKKKKKEKTKMGILRSYVDKLDVALRHPAVDPHFTKIENTIKLPRKYLASLVICLLSICALIGYLNQLTMVIGFIYPAYKSIKAIESENTKDDRRWLVYWVVYSSMIIVEYASDWLLFWVPFYYSIKAGILIWCMHPNYEGSQFIYGNLIRPVFLKNENKIDQFVDDVQNKSGSYVQNLVGEMGEIGTEMINDKNVQEGINQGLAVAGQKVLAANIAQQQQNLVEETAKDKNE